jgi:S1-C subfamily serine protease
VNVLDLAILLLASSAAVGGHRLGLVARSLSWAGLVLGLVLGARIVPAVVEGLGPAPPTSRFLVATGTLLGSALVGQALGLVVGARAHVALPAAGRPLDRLGGGLAGIVGVLAAVWLLLPTMADVPGAASRLARGSRIARAIDEAAPDAPDTLQALRRLVGEGSFPQVFSTLRPAPEVGLPPGDAGMPASVLARASAATARIEVRACDRIKEGSGFVAEEGIVVTNAHVVAGGAATEVARPDGSRVGAEVVHFDPDRDLAVLAVPDVGVGPLPIGDVEVGGTGSVLGHPGGGPLEPSPFAVREEVEAVGRDLYDDHDTRRRVLVLASDLAPGDSGAPAVDAAGSVVGVAFAIAPDRSGTAYALTTEELRAALAAPRAAGGVDTGPCLS